MRRLWTALPLVLIALLVLTAPTGAGVSWCRADPIVRLNGTVVQILVAVPDQHVAAVNGPIAVEIATPRDVARELLLTDAGFNGHGETVAFSNLYQHLERTGDTFPVAIKISLPVDATLLPADGSAIPVEVTVIPDNGPTIVYYGTHLAADEVVMIQGGALHGGRLGSDREPATTSP